jgi:Tfp pilus assembly protein PilN
MNRKPANDDLVIGGEPRVDLLPPEVKSRHKARAVRRALALTVVGVLVLAAAGTAAASWRAEQSKAELASAQARTDSLLAEQGTFAEVRTVQDQLDTALAAREVGVSTEIDWKSYLEAVRAVLPADVTITTVGVDSQSPLTPFQQATVPLQAQRVATLSLALTSPSLPTVPQWLEALTSLPGYADGAPGSITQSETGGYLVNLVLHINQDAYSKRFADTASTGGK